MVRLFFILLSSLTIAFSIFISPKHIFAQVEPAQPLPVSIEPSPTSSQTYYKAKVIEILKDVQTGTVMKKNTQAVRVVIENGDEVGKEVIVSHGESITQTRNFLLSLGDSIIIEKFVTSDGISYFLSDRYRLDSLLIIFGIFVVLAGFFGRLKGITSLFGMLLSISVLAFILIPGILSGKDPIFMSLLSAFLIAVLSLYLAHGLSKKTTIALIATLITLGIAVALATLFVFLANLSGAGSEEALFLQASGKTFNLQGLLLGGIIIGALGVLDDITTAQVAVISELHTANSRLATKELFAKGLVVGREHIASLVNTLVLAYASASLPLFLLFFLNSGEPLWVIFNSEHIAEEVIRTLVGSSSLILAVPISTYLAAQFLIQKKQ